MSATSKHYGDVGIWIEKIIESCKTIEQADNCYILVHLFYKKYRQYSGEKHLYILMENKYNYLLHQKYTKACK